MTMELEEVLHRRKDATLKRINALRASLASIIAENIYSIEEYAGNVLTREGSECNVYCESITNENVETKSSNNSHNRKPQNKDSIETVVSLSIPEQHEQHLLTAAHVVNDNNIQESNADVLLSTLNETLERHNNWSHVIMHVIEELQAIKNANTQREQESHAIVSVEPRGDVNTSSCNDMIDAKAVKIKLKELLREFDVHLTGTQGNQTIEDEEGSYNDNIDILQLCDKLQSAIHEHVEEREQYLERRVRQESEQQEQTLCAMNKQLHNIISVLRTCAHQYNCQSDTSEAEVTNDKDIAIANINTVVAAVDAQSINVDALLAETEQLSRMVATYLENRNEELEREGSVTCAELEKAKQTIRRMTTERVALKRKVEQATRTQQELESKLTETEKLAEHYKEQMEYALAQKAAADAECKHIKHLLEEYLTKDEHVGLVENTNDNVGKESTTNIKSSKTNKMVLRTKLLEFASNYFEYLAAGNRGTNKNESEVTKEESSSSAYRSKVKENADAEVNSESRLIYFIKRWLECKNADNCSTQTLVDYMDDSGIVLQSCTRKSYESEYGQYEYITQCAMLALAHSLHLITTRNKELWHKLAECLAHFMYVVLANDEMEKIDTNYQVEKQSIRFATVFTNYIRASLHYIYELIMILSRQHVNSESNTNHHHLLVLYFAIVCFTMCRQVCEEEMLFTSSELSLSSSASLASSSSAFRITRERENYSAHKTNNKQHYTDCNIDDINDNDDKANMEVMQEVLHVLLTHIASREHSSISAVQLLANDDDVASVTETNFITEVMHVVQTSCALTLFAHPQHFSVQQALLMRTLSLVWQVDDKDDLPGHVVVNCNERNNTINKCNTNNNNCELHRIKVTLVLALSWWSQLFLTPVSKSEPCKDNASTINAIIKHWYDTERVLQSSLQTNNNTSTQRSEELKNELHYIKYTQFVLHYIFSCINKSLLPLLINTAFAFTKGDNCVAQLIDVYEVLYTYYTRHFYYNNNGRYVDENNKKCNSQFSKKIIDKYTDVNNTFTSVIVRPDNFMHPLQMRCTLERIRDMSAHINDVHVPENVMLASQEEVLFLLKENCEYKRAIAKLLDTFEHKDANPQSQFINYNERYQQRNLERKRVLVVK